MVSSFMEAAFLLSNLWKEKVSCRRVSNIKLLKENLVTDFHDEEAQYTGETLQGIPFGEGFLLYENGTKDEGFRFSDEASLSKS